VTRHPEGQLSTLGGRAVAIRSMRHPRALRNEACPGGTTGYSSSLRRRNPTSPGSEVPGLAEAAHARPSFRETCAKPRPGRPKEFGAAGRSTVSADASEAGALA